MVLSTQLISIQPSSAELPIRSVEERWQGIVVTTIREGTSGLLFNPDLLNLVMQCLLPQTSSKPGWITEWAAEPLRTLITEEVLAANTPLNTIPKELTPKEKPINLIDLVIQYLKSDVCDIEDLETACGKEEMTKVLGNYAPQRPLPFEVDFEMQTDLLQLWDAETLKPFGTITKVSELFSVYVIPDAAKGVSANQVMALGSKHGTRFHPFSWGKAIREHGDTPLAGGSVILFPNDIFGAGKPFAQQQALVPPGWSIPHFEHVVFCSQVKFICKRIRILPVNPWTYTRVVQKTDHTQLVAGSNSAKGLNVNSKYYGSKHDISQAGVAILRLIKY